MVDASETRPRPLKERLKDIPAEDEIMSRIANTLGASDYETAVLAGSLVDAMLRHAIVSRFVPLGKTAQDALFSDTAPLATFSAKLRIAYALGIISGETRGQIERIKLIRNAFAHVPESVSFGDPSVFEDCMLLKPYNKSSSFAKAETEFSLGTKTPTSRFRYATSCLTTATELRGYIFAYASSGILPKPIDCFSSKPKADP